MKVSYEYDQDPRYGWASIDLEDSEAGLIVVSDEFDRCYGFKFFQGVMRPTCICNAWSENECACPNVDWR